MQDIKQWATKAEEIIDCYGGPIQPYLPVVARFLLVVTFLEDTVRLISQWNEQTL